MPVSLEGILLASDLDGTLIDSAYQIPQRNLDALCDFMGRGGRFAIATGRAIESAYRYVRVTHPNAPCIVLNGTMLYDYRTNRVLWGNPLPPEAVSYLTHIFYHFPEVGIEVCTEKGIHVIRENPYIHRHLFRENIKHTNCSLQQVEGQWYKVFFAMDSQLMEQVRAYMETIPHQRVRFVPSSSYYLEMLPEEADKGTALKRLTAMLDLDQNNSYAIGDYYNDIELLRAAGVGIVPQNAPMDIQKLAGHVVCRCELGAVADAIAVIERNWMEKSSKH